MSSGKEKSKKASKRDRDVAAVDPGDCGESVDTLSEVEVKMRLEAMDTFGKWYVAKVVEVDEDSGEVLVHFDRWSSRYDEYIPIAAGRLRKLTPSRLKALQKEKEPVYAVGDRVQAKWEDGKMYYGKVLRVHEDEVDVLFDDGVEYTAPLRSVRRRRLEKPTEPTSESSQSSVGNQAAEARRSRARKRSRNDDSASQSSLSSPPSSPLTSSQSKRPCRRLDSDSTETESDIDDPLNPHIGECPLKQRSASSDSEQPLKKGRAKKLREPYKLRKVSKLEPVKEDEVKTLNDSTDSDGSGLGALLTPPPGDVPRVKSTAKPPSPKKESPTKRIPNPTPPETPQTDSNSGSGILKQMLSQDGSPAAQTKKAQSNQDSATSPSRKKPPVSSRTRAQTKFENITKKVDKKDKKQIKTAPKELVIVWDHNEFKCKFTGCNKSFRKENLLQSHIKHYHTKETKMPRTPSKLKGQPGTPKKSQSPKSPQSQRSPLSPSRFSLSPRTPKTPVSQDEAVKSPRSRKPKSILSPLPRRNPPRARTSAEIESREKSPTESFFEIMEKEKKSGEVMQLLELVTKEHKAMATYHSHMTHHVPMKTTEKEGTSGHPSSSSKGPSSSSKTPSSSSKKQKQTSMKVNSPAVASVAAPPQITPVVDAHTLSRDSLPHSISVIKTASEFSSVMPSTSASGGVARGGRETQLNDSDSMEDMDTSSEFVEGGGEGRSLFPSNTNEASEEDVVHCLCDSTEDEGFMIQCEQCLCWQHGDCVGLTEETLPKKYICYICDNPPGLRKRYRHQFDQEWFSEGTLPSLPGGPKFPNAEHMKKTHELASELYKLRKMMHSSKVKLQAASTVNHPYLKQWTKECTHLGKDDIMSYIMASLLPVSYPRQTTTDHEPKESETTMSDEEPEEKQDSLSNAERAAVEALASSFDSDVVTAAAFSSLNGGDQPGKAGTEDTPIDVSLLHLDPLPRSPPSPEPPHAPSSDAATTREDSPDPRSLQLAPLPPLTSEDHLALVTDAQRTSPLDIEEEQGGNVTSSKGQSPHNPKATASSLEVFNDEFGIQEMSVFATSTGHQVTTLEHADKHTQPGPLGSSPGRLISSSRSAFRPVIAAPQCDATSSVPTSTPRTAGQASSGQSSTASLSNSKNGAELKPKVSSDSLVVMQTLSSLPSASSSKSGMDSVTLGEFSEAFMKGDTTNWFQRMLLLDHIEAIQDKIRLWMEMINKQLDAMPDEGSQLEDMETLLKNVQSSVEQLGKLQQAAAAVS